MKKIKVVWKKFVDFCEFNEPITFGESIFHLICFGIIVIGLTWNLTKVYFEPIERYLYVEHGVFLRDYSDIKDTTSDKLYEELEEYKKSLEETGDKK